MSDKQNTAVISRARSKRRGEKPGDKKVRRGGTTRKSSVFRGTPLFEELAADRVAEREEKAFQREEAKRQRIANHRQKVLEAGESFVLKRAGMLYAFTSSEGHSPQVRIISGPAREILERMRALYPTAEGYTDATSGRHYSVTDVVGDVVLKEDKPLETVLDGRPTALKYNLGAFELALVYLKRSTTWGYSRVSG